MRGADQAPRITVPESPSPGLSGWEGFAAQALMYQNQLVKIPAEMPFPQAAVAWLRRIGVSSPDSQVTLNLVDAALQQPGFVGVNTGSTNLKRDIPLYSRFYLDGRLELDALASGEISLDQIESGCQQLAEPDVSRVVVTSF